MLMGMAKPMPLALAADRGVDADHLALQVEERAAGVARVDGRVGLEEVEIAARIEALHVLAGAPLRRKDARRYGVRQAEGVADGDDPVADLDARRSRRGQSARRFLVFDSDDRDVGAACRVPRVRRRCLAPSANFTLICGGVLDDVVVGEHETGLVVDEAGAEPFATIARRRPVGLTSSMRLMMVTTPGSACLANPANDNGTSDDGEEAACAGHRQSDCSALARHSRWTRGAGDGAGVAGNEHRARREPSPRTGRRRS